MAVAHQSGGTLGVLACPPALCPHAEFAVAGVLAAPVALTWTAQDARPQALRAALAWQGPPGSAGRLAAALRRVGPLCFDVAEQAGPGSDAERYSYSPELGLYRATLGANGDVMVGEDQLAALLARSGSTAELAHGVGRLLGRPWDAVLEPLRRAADGHPGSLLRRTG